MVADPAPATPARGRPTTFDAALGLAICERLMDGESLRRICTDDDMPSRGQVLRWLVAEAEFRMQYRQAKLLCAELLADEIIEIADDSAHDWKTTASGDLVPNPEVVARSRLRIDTRKWVLSKVMPRTYGPIAADQQAEPGAPVGAGTASGDAGTASGDGSLAPPPPTRLTLTPQQRAAVNKALAWKTPELAHG